MQVSRDLGQRKAKLGKFFYREFKQTGIVGLEVDLGAVPEHLTVQLQKTAMQAAQYLVYAAAMKKQNHEDYSVDAAMAKLFAAEAASDVTRRAVQLFGGYGYTREYPVERMMRDAKITEIYEGTSEVQRMVIASHLGVK